MRSSLQRDFPSHSSQPLIQWPIHKTFKMLLSLSSCPSLRGTGIHHRVPDCWHIGQHIYQWVFTLINGWQTSEQTGGVKKRGALHHHPETWHSVVMVADCESYNYLCLVSSLGSSTVFTLQLWLVVCHTSDWTVEKCCSTWGTWECALALFTVVFRSSLCLCHYLLWYLVFIKLVSSPAAGVWPVASNTTIAS